MPLLVLASESTQPPSVTPPPVSPRTTPTITWTAADGEVTHLSSGFFRALAGAQGVDMPTFTHYKDTSPAVNGSFHRAHRTTDREIFLPLDIKGYSRADFIARKRAFLRAVDPKRGPGMLTWAEPDGTRRHIGCFYLAGLEGEYGDLHLPTWQRFPLRLEALEPYWFGDDITLEWAGSGAARPFFPIPGADGFYEVVSPSQVLGTTTVDIAGDVDAHPVWTVTGPSTGLTFTNHTTEKTLTLSASLTESQSRVIDTRPGQVSIVDESGANRWPELGDGSALWHLAPGINELSITVDSSTEDTRARLTYRERFHGV